MRNVRPRGGRSGVRRLIPGSIRGTLLLLLLIMVVPELLVETGHYYSTFETRRARELQTELELARSVATTFDVYLKDILRQELAIGLAISLPQPLPSEHANRLLVESAREYPSIRFYGWVDRQGRVVAASLPEVIGQDLSGGPYFREIVEGREWAVSNLLRGRSSGEATFVIGRGIRDESGTFQGIVAAMVDPRYLSEVLRVERAEKGSIGIVDGQGLLVYRYPGSEPTWEERNLIDVRTVIAQVLNGGDVTTVHVSPVDKQSRVVGFTPIRSIGWVATASRPEAEAMAPVVQELFRDSWYKFLVIVLTVLAVVIISRYITVPMRRLREHAIALGSGELGHRVEAVGPTELEELAHVFNRMAEEVQVREEAQRFLAESSALLASSLDYEATLASVARLAVPTIADICAVETVDENQSLRQITLACADPSKEELVRETRRRYQSEANVPHPIRQALCTGESQVYADTPDPSREAPTQDDGQLGIRSGMAVPLIARGRTIGLISFESFEPGRSFGSADLALAEGLAHRAALAIDNARLYGEAQQAIRARDEFLSAAAHELKTPITSLRGFAQLTVRQLNKDGTLDPLLVRRALQVIDSQSNKLSYLVSQLLDISRIDAGKLTLDRRVVDITSLIEGVVTPAQATTSRHQITLRAPSSVPALVDPLRLEQVVTNLIDNAIKYSPSGGSIEIEVSTPTPEMVRLTVRDHGIGIPPEHRQHIFDRFYQAHANDHFGGMGLGLHISREIVNLHGGQIEVEYPPEGGTHFVITLPTDLGNIAT